MSDDTAPAPEPTEAAEAAPAPEATADATSEEKPKKRRGNRAPRKPSFKDWIRVINSAGNSCPNTTVHLIYNEATGVCTLVTNAPAKEGSEDLEGERRQIFKVTSHEVINVPEPEPEPEPAPAPPAEPAAAAE
jgi:hypothetical protein